MTIKHVFYMHKKVWEWYVDFYRGRTDYPGGWPTRDSAASQEDC